MADDRFRIIVDLSTFFHDHRRVARIFVKSHLKTIANLQNRISEIFEISDFYLTTGSHFLPASEDVRILNNNETVCVIPNKPQEISGQSSIKVTSSTQRKEHKKQKRALEVIPEDSGEASISKKKKSKKKQIDIVTYSSNSSDDEVPCKKKKNNHNENLVCSTETKQLSKGIKKKVKESFNSTHSSSGSSQSIVEKEICNIETSQKIIDIKKKLKQQADEYIQKHSKATIYNSSDVSPNIKNVLPKLQSHIKSCNDLGRSTLPDTVRLSRHVDTPIKTFSQYKPPPRITDTYLAKNKVNIVKIDIIKKDDEKLTEPPNESKSSACTDNGAHLSNEGLVDISPQKNYVKEVVNSFEKSISPESKKNISEKEINDDGHKILKESEASNYTKAFLDQRDPPITENLDCKTDKAVNYSMKLGDIAPKPKIIIGSLEHFESLKNVPVAKTMESQIEKPGIEEFESTDISLDISSIPRDSPGLNSTSNNSTFNSTNTSIALQDSSVKPRDTTANKRFVGVGSLLERLRESDSVISHESDTSGQYVTKRKRVRKHRKRNRKSIVRSESAAVEAETIIIKPMNIKASPSVHIKFEDDEVMPLEAEPCINSDISKETNLENPIVTKTEEPKSVTRAEASSGSETKSLVMEMLVISDENDDPIMENKAIFGEESILKAPLMTNKIEPKVGDVIAFKILKMAEDYTPVVSNYIVGKLQNYVLENRRAFFRILHGEEELSPPSGKLSLKEDENLQNSNYKEFSWIELISPKLLYP